MRNETPKNIIHLTLGEYLETELLINTLVIIYKDGVPYASFLNDGKTINYLNKDLIVKSARAGGISLPTGHEKQYSTCGCIFIDV